MISRVPSRPAVLGLRCPSARGRFGHEGRAVKQNREGGRKRAFVPLRGHDPQASVLLEGHAPASDAPLLLFPPCQELLSREEELKQAALKQKSQEEFLRQREHELAQWELEVFERELSLLIQQMNRERPHVKKRKGTFKRNKLKGRDSERISMPLGTGRAGRVWIRTCSPPRPPGPGCALLVQFL